MSILLFTSIVWVVSILAGLLGALTGLGGAVAVVPFLTLVLGVDIRYAVGAALISVIATSCGAAANFVREGYTNLRLAMLLEVATAIGALVGAASAVLFSTSAVSILFGLVLLLSVYPAFRGVPPVSATSQCDPLAARLRLDATGPLPGGLAPYRVRNVAGGFSLMVVAGWLSGLLGIGAGAFKVLAMDRMMRLPFKVSTSTSNFIIGVTAAAGAGVYLARGRIDFGLAMPVTLGVLPGAMLGAYLLGRAPTRILRMIFACVLLVLGLQMVRHGLAKPS